MLKIRTGRGYIKTLALGLDGKEAGVFWTTKLPCPYPESQGEWVSTSKLARTWPVESLRDFIVTMRLAVRNDPTQSYMWDKARVVQVYRKVPLYWWWPDQVTRTFNSGHYKQTRLGRTHDGYCRSIQCGYDAAYLSATPT